MNKDAIAYECQVHGRFEIMPVFGVMARASCAHEHDEVMEVSVPKWTRRSICGRTSPRVTP